jgi:hypothetical protein
MFAIEFQTRNFEGTPRGETQGNPPRQKELNEETFAVAKLMLIENNYLTSRRKLPQ